jgi:hypothetical protein
MNRIPSALTPTRGGILTTEVWFRNPDSYIRELVEAGEYKIAWDRGLLVKKRIDAHKHASLYFGMSFPWRLLLVGEQGTAELRADSSLTNPTAVYPTWSYGEDSALLEELLSQPVGQDKEACFDMSVTADERPVYGQEHRVVIINPPKATTGPGRAFLRYLKELQEDHPDAILHVHGLYGWRTAFGMGLGAADVEPRAAAQKGKVHLPSGSEERFEALTTKPKWASAMGFKPVDLAIPRNRCIFNIKSAVWAGEHYDELYNFSVRSTNKAVDTITPDASYSPPEAGVPVRGKGGVGDKQLCDTCSLQNDCKYQRDGAVCSVPGAEPIPLSRMFKSRDADTIIDGLGTLVAANAKRLEKGIRFEEIDGDLNPEVSKTMGQVFDQGVKLAKLLNPSLSGGPKVQVNVGPGGTASVAEVNPRQLAAMAVKELEQRGIPREDITGEMIGTLLTDMADEGKRTKAVQGVVTRVEDETY